MVTKRYSRPDNVFCTAHTLARFNKCDVIHGLKPAKTDHFPIEATVELVHKTVQEAQKYNFRMADWEDFNENLRIRLEELQQPKTIETKDEYIITTKALSKPYRTP